MGIDIRSILNEKIQPVYIFSGNDNYTKKKLEREIRKKLENTHGSCSVDILDSKENNIHEIISEVSAGTLFASARLIIIKRSDTLLTNETFRKFIYDFYNNDNPANIIIIETEKDRKIKKLKSYKIEAPYENQLPGWIKKNLSSNDKNITDDAANLLAFYCGRNLFNITGEIEKLITAYPDKKIYHIEEVRNVAGSHKKDDIFGYLNALVDRDEKKALILLQNLLNYGAEPLQVIGIIKWKLQQMITARSLMDTGLSEKEILEKMNLLPRFFYRGFCGKLKAFPLKVLLKSYDCLSKADLELKTVSTDKFLLLERFTFQFLTC